MPPASLRDRISDSRPVGFDQAWPGNGDERRTSGGTMREHCAFT